MLCFTIETAVGGCEGRRCERAGAAMLAYAHPCSVLGGYRRVGPPLGSGVTGGEADWNGGFQVVLGCGCCAIGKFSAELLALTWAACLTLAALLGTPSIQRRWRRCKEEWGMRLPASVVLLGNLVASA